MTFLARSWSDQISGSCASSSASASCVVSVSTSKIPPETLDALELGIGFLNQLVKHGVPRFRAPSGGRIVLNSRPNRYLPGISPIQHGDGSGARQPLAVGDEPDTLPACSRGWTDSASTRRAAFNIVRIQLVLVAIRASRPDNVKRGAHGQPRSERRARYRPPRNKPTPAIPQNTAHQSPHRARRVSSVPGWRSSTRRPCSPTSRREGTRP